MNLLVCRKKYERGGKCGFSLLEVLISLGLVSMVFGSLIGGFCQHVQRVARLGPFYRNLIVASVGLEKSMAKRNDGETDSLNDIEYKVTVGAMPSENKLKWLVP